MRALLVLLALLISAPATAEELPVVGTAQDFTLNDLNSGAQTSLKAILEGEAKVVLINFWATWCGPCLKEMPKLNEIQKKLGDKGLQIVSITIDDPRDAAKAKAITKRFKYEPVVLHDAERKVADLFDKSIKPPLTVIIDEDMNIRLKKVGFTDGDEKKLEAMVSSLLGV
jgi:cytochrome c biogenesis protein CcmG/thiol:disulfide interchange protein DsbE